MMIRTYALPAAVVAGALVVAAGSPASATQATSAGLAKAKLDAAHGEIMNVRWRGRRYWGGGYRFYRPRYYYRPRAYYYAPRYYRRCWINSWGYRVCG